MCRADPDRDVDTRVRTGPFRPVGVCYWGPSWRYYGPYGWRGWNPWFGRPFFTSTVDIDTIERYEAMAEIVMFRGTRANEQMSFDARAVLANLGPTIELRSEERRVGTECVSEGGDRWGRDHEKKKNKN